MAILELQHIGYRYKDADSKTVLQDVNAGFERGKFYAVVGSSGAGKTTLLSLLAGLDVPTNGNILVDGKNISEQGYGYHRKRHITLVFQNYNLIDYLTPAENLKLVNKKADPAILEKLGLKPEEIKRNVMKLSGGQQQRAAIGRALVSEAPIILADEPTGNLDEKTAKEIIEILKGAAHQENRCVIVVTHSKQLAREADVVMELKNKKLQMKIGGGK